DAAGRSQIVLEHPEGPRRIADQIDAADVHAHAAGRADAAQLRQVVARGEHQLSWDLSLGEDLLLSVDVVEEERERADALEEPALQLRPVGRGDRPGQEAEGKDLLRATLVVEDGESYALVEQRHLRQRLAAAEFL